MKRVAFILACLTSACASTFAGNPNDPVDMAAELGNRGRAYVGMAEVCDATAGSGHREAVVRTIADQQQRLGVLSGLVNRAYAGHASEDFATHMQTQMNAHGLSAERFCGEVVAQAKDELSQRATHILALPTYHDIMYYAREGQRPNT